jgi:hypothetical protein
MKTVIDYKPYPSAKTGIFHITSDQYGASGWIETPVVKRIIGETPLLYVSEIKPQSYMEWQGNTRVKVDTCIPRGIHKSRLIQWQQLELFN